MRNIREVFSEKGILGSVIVCPKCKYSAHRGWWSFRYKESVRDLRQSFPVEVDEVIILTCPSCNYKENFLPADEEE